MAPDDDASLNAPPLRPIRKLLLRELLIFMGFLVAASAVLVWFSTRRTLDHQIEARSQENLTRLAQDLEGFLGEAEQMGSIAEGLWRSGNIHPDTPERTESILRTFFQGFPSVSDIVLVTPEGRGLTLFNEPAGYAAYSFQAAEENLRTRIYWRRGKSLDRPEERLLSFNLFERPWFRAALTAPRAQWVDLYPFIPSSSARQGITYVVPLRDQGRLTGIISVDLHLDTLSRRVWETRPTPGSLTLVCDEQHRAVIVPPHPPSTTPTQEDLFLRPVTESAFPLFQTLLERWKEGGGVERPLRLSFQGQSYSGRVRTLHKSSRVPWLLCITIPDRDYLGPGWRQLLLLGGLGVVMLGLATWRILRLAHRFSAPMEALASAAYALGAGETPTPVSSGIEEVHALGEAIHRAGLALAQESELRMELQHAQRLETVGTLTGGIAHDVNNQLAVIAGQISLGREFIEIRPEEARKRMDSAESAAHRCAKMIKSLLGFTHRTHPELEDVDLNELVQRTTALVGRLLGGRVQLELDLAPSALHVMCEPVSLEQVITNLALNARDAMPEGGRLLISTHATASGESCLSVKDSGTGIPEAIRSKIFDPFFTTKEVGKGSGLGLAMVLSIVQSHGGRLEVDSETGKGTEFRVFLPSTFASGVLPAPEPLPRNPAAGDLHDLRILVVDDEADLRELLVEAITGTNAEVDSAKDGLQAWALMQRVAYDLVISDQRMPGMTGLELLDKARQQHMKVPFLLISGFGLEGATDASAHDPRVKMLAKPFTLDSLFAQIHDLLKA